MNPLTLEWVQKAEADFAAAQCLCQAGAAIHQDAICFHAQQCIEKYLKAWMQETGLPIRKSHDLEVLLDLVVPAMPAWNSWRNDFIVLSTHAVEFRYPGRSASVADVQHSTQISAAVRNAIRISFGLSPAMNP